ncbi:MAG: tyramine oxidase, partial [Aldersonia sp.]|nr:tyramine oxidase [Aldersonia sp.]
MTAPNADHSIATTSPTVDHPLTPLTAAEIDSLRELLSSEGLVGESVRFVYVGLDEPAKSTVLAYCPGDPIARAARVLLLDRDTGIGTDVRVSLSERRVLSATVLDAANEGHVPILDAEFEDIEMFLLDSSEWL